MEAAGGYRAALESSAVFRRPGRGRIAVAGADRRSYLQAMLTNDVLALQPGHGCYAAYLTPQGRMIADMKVLDLGDMVLLDLSSSAAPLVLQKLDQFVFSEDVKLGDLTEVFEQVVVAGPASARVVAAVLDGGASAPSADDLASWAEFRNARASFGADTVVVAASRDAGVPGFEIYVERPRTEALVAALLAAGAVEGTADAFATLRIEAGRPAFGDDMDAETIPLEAGIEDRAISFTKGCYPGQEVIVRVVRRGQGRVVRRLTGLRVVGNVVPERGDVVRTADREVGKVTSAVFSPRGGGVIAIAMLHRDVQAPGTPVTIDRGGQVIEAVVAPLPLVS